jgi:hypothetical protein
VFVVINDDLKQCFNGLCSDLLSYAFQNNNIVSYFSFGVFSFVCLPVYVLIVIPLWQTNRAN